MIYLLLDLKATTSQRLQIDPVALISEIWNTVVENCFYVTNPKKMYNTIIPKKGILSFYINF